MIAACQISAGASQQTGFEFVHEPLIGAVDAHLGQASVKGIQDGLGIGRFFRDQEEVVAGLPQILRPAVEAVNFKAGEIVSQNIPANPPL